MKCNVMGHTWVTEDGFYFEETKWTGLEILVNVSAISHSMKYW